MKLSIAEKVVIGIALLAASFTLGFFAGRGIGGETFVIETEKQIAEVSDTASDFLGNTDASENADASEAEVEAEAEADAPQESGDSPDGLININTADSELLQTLPGIGEKIAERIIAFREENGGFAIIDEIMDVDGIGEKIFESIEPMITVD